ncbi:ORC-CDC6 family AAA ATPase [Agromyces sp. Root1464]|uniref:ORC-CDC6 family AAA ATPase n=1 Tax=Agromyces sp. Root1464 TaxID=1736467 RepID=UPI0012F89AD4|nr:hypothetical protein [Agromyces sp. Root1464]
MSPTSQTALLESITRAMGQVRAEYENDDDLYRRFSAPLYFHKLLGLTPAFLIGGRGTGKTTTLRSMSYRGQAKVSKSSDPGLWPVIGAYWKVEPSVVTAFKGRGVDEDTWTRVFSHYLNLRLSALVVDFARWAHDNHRPITFDKHRVTLFTRALHLRQVEDIEELANEIDLALVDIESKLNGSISALSGSPLSLLGRPLEHLFDAIGPTGVTRERPFMFCLDEFENLVPYQKKIVNTLIKQVGSGPFTFKIGVRNTIAIDPSTLVDGQPIQDPADFTKIDIVADLKDESFEQFAATVVTQRLDLVSEPVLAPSELLPAISADDEAVLLGADELKKHLRQEVLNSAAHTAADLQFVDAATPLESALAVRWAESHGEPVSELVQWAVKHPAKWQTRIVNYSYAALFTIRTNRVGPRKYYAGWKTYCQMADGNIRYMIRLVHEALRLHVLSDNPLDEAVSIVDQTDAATRVGETTVRDLQGWSRQGADLTRLTLGLGSIFGSLAREAALSTPEVNQFRVGYSGSMASSLEVERLLGEAVGQGVLIGFEGDKNARRSGATPEMDYQLHPVLSPFFVYSPRSKRRMTLQADQVVSLTKRETAGPTVRKVLATRGAAARNLPDEITLFSDAIRD